MSETLLLISGGVRGLIVGTVPFIEIGPSPLVICLEVCDTRKLRSCEQERAAQSHPWAMPTRRSHQRKSSAVRVERAGIREEPGEALCTNSHNCCLRLRVISRIMTQNGSSVNFGSSGKMEKSMPLTRGGLSSRPNQKRKD